MIATVTLIAVIIVLVSSFVTLYFVIQSNRRMSKAIDQAVKQAEARHTAQWVSTR